MEKIYKEYALTVFKFLKMQTHNDALSEELCQETFYQAVKSIDSFDGSCKMSVWLCQIAKHSWYKYLGKNSKEIPTEESESELISSSAEDEALANEGNLQLIKKIHLLNETAKEIVYLRSFGGLSFKEIGLVIGKSETYARVTFYRAKEKLKGETEYDK